VTVASALRLILCEHGIAHAQPHPAIVSRDFANLGQRHQHVLIQEPVCVRDGTELICADAANQGG